LRTTVRVTVKITRTSHTASFVLIVDSFPNRAPLWPASRYNYNPTQKLITVSLHIEVPFRFGMDPWRVGFSPLFRGVEPAANAAITLAL
jgi:hypothetical protein